MPSAAYDCSAKDDEVQLVSAPEAGPAIQQFLGLDSESKLSRAGLESLSIVAYRQPITRPEIDELRGVNSDGVLRTLLSHGLVAPIGRRETVGHPIEYGTTFQFLEYFGISSLDELPPIDIPTLMQGAESGEAESVKSDTGKPDNDETENEEAENKETVIKEAENIEASSTGDTSTDNA